MNKLPLFTLIVLAVAFWISAIVLLVMGLTQKNLGILKWVAVGDAVVAVIFTMIAARKWTVN